MATRSDKTYQDPRATGSLSSALRLWQAVESSPKRTPDRRVVFTLSCWSESRATRLAGSLRRRRACAVTRIHQVAGARRDTWHVHGFMSPAIRSLSDLETTWSWLQRTAHSHQVALLRVTLAPAPASA